MKQIPMAVMLVCLVLGGVFLSSCTTDTAGTNKTIVKPSDLALGTADYALETYREEIIETLSQLVTFATVKVDGVENVDNPEFKGMTDYLRRPAGKEHRDLEDEIRLTIKRWQEENNVDQLPVSIYLGDPHLIEDAPHIPVLLGVFSHYTGEENPQPLAASGGTHARLLPNDVSFGPHMPGRAYSGHSEYEYLLLEELDLDIKMYTAMLVDLVSK